LSALPPAGPSAAAPSLRWRPPTLAIAGSALSGNQSLAGTSVVVVSPFTTDDGSGRGGAVGAVAGDVSISNSAITSNLAEGGALFAVSQGATLIQFVFGGGIDYHEFGSPAVSPTLSITGSTIRDNVALGNGSNLARRRWRAGSVSDRS
jgi:hypothetical protein